MSPTERHYRVWNTAPAGSKNDSFSVPFGLDKQMALDYASKVTNGWTSEVQYRDVPVVWKALS